jgi:hypothetical protein
VADIERLDIYKEQYAHFRSMNDILYKIPPMFTAVLGGLWYFAVQTLEKDKLVSCAVFAFSAIASVCFVNIMARFREAFNAYISNLNVMDGNMKVTIKPSPTPSTPITQTECVSRTALQPCLLCIFQGQLYKSPQTSNAIGRAWRRVGLLRLARLVSPSVNSI